MDKENAKNILNRQLKSISALRNSPRFSPEFKKWRRDTEIAIQQIFGDNTRHIKDFEYINYQLLVWHSGIPAHEETERYHKGLENAASVLQSMIDEINEYWEDKKEEKALDSDFSYFHEPLVFPDSIDLRIIVTFLEAFFPEREVQIIDNSGQKFFLVENKYKFELEESDNYKKLFLIAEGGDIFENPCFILLTQVNHRFMFDILEYIDPVFYDQYFKAIFALMNEDMRIAALNLGYIAEHFSKKVLKELIPNSLGSPKGIKEIREYINNHDDFSDLINVTQMIRNSIKLSIFKKELLLTLFHGFHYLRELRNRSLHPEAIFTAVLPQTILSCLNCLQVDVTIFLNS